MRVFVVVCCFFLFTFKVNAGSCPNDCSSHGTCNGQSCTCFTGWDELPDCSKRGCPSDRAWFSKPTETDAHHVMECSNNGFCDSQKGSCTCFDGFTGNSCQRRSCPGDCNGHVRRFIKTRILLNSKIKIHKMKGFNTLHSISLNSFFFSSHGDSTLLTH